MRNKKAKKIKKTVYGDKSVRNRKYRKLSTGQVVADPMRQAYQRLKKETV